MNDLDRVLLEQFVTIRGISFDKCLDYLKLILNSRDFVNPIYKESSFVNTELVVANFNKEEDYVYVSGAFSLDNNDTSENRCFMMKIYEDDKSIKLVSEVDRLGDVKDKKKYFVIDKFIKKDNGYNRYTIYDDGKSFKEYKSIGMTLDDGRLNHFIKEKTRKVEQKKVL